jgi:hypothetical protein
VRVAADMHSVGGSVDGVDGVDGSDGEMRGRQRLRARVVLVAAAASRPRHWPRAICAAGDAHHRASALGRKHDVARAWR